MALVDYQLQFSDAQAVTDTAVSTNVIDTDIADADLGGSGNAWVVVQVSTAFADATSMKVTLQDCATADGSYDTLLDSEVYLEAALTKGARLMCVPLPAEHKRYLNINYTVVGTHGSGAVDAYITLAPQTK